MYNTAAIHQMNKWVWVKLLAQFPEEFQAYTLENSPTENLVPIIPAQQVPTFNDIVGGAPFIVYSYAQNGVNNGIWGMVEQCVYVVYDNDEERLRKIHNYLFHLLRRQDFTAQEANGFVEESFDIKTVEVISATGPAPFETEGGRQAASIIFRIAYTHDMDTGYTADGQPSGQTLMRS